MVGWHHQLDGHEFESTQGVGDGHGGLACCRPQVTKSWTRLIELNGTWETGKKFNKTTKKFLHVIG